MKTETFITHAARDSHAYEGSVNTPAFRSSTILFKTLAEFEQCEKGNAVRPLVYGRSNTPASRELEEALATLDHMDHAILTCSGQMAIVVLLNALLSAGDHLLLPDSVYGSMRKYCTEELVRMGVEISYYDPVIGAGVAEHIRPNTKIVYCESPGSQTFEMQDIPAIAAVAKAKGITVVADNTWATPLFQNTRALGADINIHACTKYLSGHADVVMGLITCTKELYPLLRRVYRNFGACPGSEEIYLCTRGLRTLSLRLAQHQKNALALAQWLSTRKEVARVFHPALPSDPGHALWKRDCTGSSGLFSFELKPCSHKALAAMLDNMKLFAMGFSWGAYESLLVPFKALRTASPNWNPKGTTLRLHAGLENVDDLIADLEEGFKRLGAAA